MKNYTASRPTWEEKNAQIASRLQNSILTQNLSVKSAQNFMDKFVHKQSGTKNSPSPSSLIEPSSYYAASISSDNNSELPDSDNMVVTSSNINSAEVQSSSSVAAKPLIKTKVVGKVLASPIPSGGGGAATAAAKIPRGVVTATPVTTQNTTLAPTTPSQQQQSPSQQQGAINPTAISLANALKALAAAQSRAQQQQQQLQKKNINAFTTAVEVPEKPVVASTTGVTKEPMATPTTPVTTMPPMNIADKMIPVAASGSSINVPEVLRSEVAITSPSQVAAFVQSSVAIQTQQPTSSTGNNVQQESADTTTLNESTSTTATKPQVSLNAILGTNLSPEAERLLSALITSLQPSQVSTSSPPAVAQSLPTTSVISSSALSFCNTVSSEQSQGAPQYAPFPSSGTRTTTEQLVSGNATDDHFIDQDDETNQLLQTTALVDDGPLSASTDLGDLCDLGSFPSTSDNKRPLELSDSLFTGSSIKRPHVDDNAEF